MLPDMRDLRKVQLKFLFRLHNAKALCKCLHHAIFDPVMDHLDIMSRAMWTHVAPSFICARCQRFENWVHLFHDFAFATDHQAISFGDPPNPSTRAAVHKLDPFWFEKGSMPHGFFVIGIATINDRVTSFEKR